jgi:hypothetical protein
MLTISASGLIRLHPPVSPIAVRCKVLRHEWGKAASVYMRRMQVVMKMTACFFKAVAGIYSCISDYFDLSFGSFTFTSFWLDTLVKIDFARSFFKAFEVLSMAAVSFGSFFSF